MKLNLWRSQTSQPKTSIIPSKVHPPPKDLSVPKFQPTTKHNQNRKLKTATSRLDLIQKDKATQHLVKARHLHFQKRSDKTKQKHRRTKPGQVTLVIQTSNSWYLPKRFPLAILHVENSTESQLSAIASPHIHPHHPVTKSSHSGNTCQDQERFVVVVSWSGTCKWSIMPRSWKFLRGNLRGFWWRKSRLVYLIASDHKQLFPSK